MKRSRTVTLMCTTVVMMVGVWAVSVDAAAFPLQVSADGRYLEDQNGDPFFVHCDTVRELGIRYSTEDARYYLDVRKSQGFNAQLWLLIPWQTDEYSVYGRLPFTGDNRHFNSPNEAYWQDMDRAMEAAASRGVLTFCYPLWVDCCRATWSEAMLNANTDEDMRQYGIWLANRYINYNNIIWMQGGDSDSGLVQTRINAMVAGINSVHSVNLHTFHAVCAQNATDEWRAYQTWLNVSSIYTYGRDTSACSHMSMDWYAYEHAKREWDKHNGKPFIFVEGHYEDTAPHQWFYRRYPIWTVLGGGTGHVFGHGSLFHPGGNWRDELNSPATTAMINIKKAFVDEAQNWYELIPDWDHQVLTSGYGDFTSNNYIVCASAPAGTLIMAYVTHGYGSRTFSVDMSTMSQPATAFWFDPTNGNMISIGTDLPNSGSRSFTSPGTNSMGHDDWLLIIKAPEGPQLEAPSNVTATAVDAGHVNLSWQDNSTDPQEDRFIIQRKPYHAQGDTWSDVGQANQDETTFADAIDLHGMVEYTYRVGAAKE